MPTDETAAAAIRLVAGLIDLISVYAVAFVGAVLVAVFRPIDPAFPVHVQLALAYGLLVLIVGTPVAIFLVLPPCLGRSTFGQFVMRVRTVRYPSLDKLGVGLSAVATILAVISIPLTVLVSFVNEGDRLWYDAITGTAVVGLRRNKPPLICQQCGYDLRGSLDTGRCPECGTIFKHCPASVGIGESR